MRRNKNPRDHKYYKKTLKQPYDIVFSENDNVSCNDKDEIYKFIDDNKKVHYYINMPYLYSSYCDMDYKGNFKFEQCKEILYFPEVIHAKVQRDGERNNFYIELTESAFSKVKCETLNKRNENNCLLNYLKDRALKLNTVDEKNTLNEKHDNKEYINTDGQLPINYDELISSLQLKDTYGKLAPDIENDIKKAFNNAKFKINAPTTTVEDSKFISNLESKLTNIKEELSKLCSELHQHISNNTDNTKNTKNTKNTENIENIEELENDEWLNEIQQEIQNNGICIQQENIDKFVKAMNGAVIDKITRTYDINPSFITERCKQLAYNLALNINADDHNSMLQFRNAAIKTSHMNAMLALFFVNLIYHRNADYDVPKNSNMRLPKPSYCDDNKDYIAFISCDNAYEGFMSNNDYWSILYNNISKLIPGISENYINIVSALQNYLKQAGFGYVRTITER